MSTTNTTTKFEAGKVVRVWEPKGVKNLSKGLSTSERSKSNGKGANNDFEDIMPSEELLCLKRINANEWLCQREDGTEVKVHINHIDSSKSYNIKAGAKAETSDERITRLKAELAKAQAEMEEAQVEAMIAEEAKSLEAANG